MPTDSLQLKTQYRKALDSAEECLSRVSLCSRHSLLKLGGICRLQTELETGIAKARKLAETGRYSDALRALAATMQRSLDRARRLKRKPLIGLIIPSDLIALLTRSHQLSLARKKLRSPSRMDKKAGEKPRIFDAEWYLARNPDVAAARLDPYSHYVNKGWREGRNPHPLFALAWYLETNQDVRAAGLEPLTHYLDYGWKEGRNPHPLFAAAWYANHNADVRSAQVEPLGHYLTCGWKEGRSPHPFFDPDFYLKQDTEALTQHLEPLARYLDYGVKKGYRPHRGFDPNWYLQTYPDVRTGGVEPLCHYVEHGSRLGYAPMPPDAGPEQQRSLNAALAAPPEKPHPAQGIPATWFAATDPVFPQAGIKSAEEERITNAYLHFMTSDERIQLAGTPEPLITIIVCVYNKPAFLLECLRTVAAHVHLPFEVLVWDDASTEEMDSLYARIDGARIFRSQENQHFVLANNAAARHARGEFLLLLNSDAFVGPRAVSSSLDILQSDDRIGAVGGLLELPDGSVQEAGCAVWSDGSCAGIGRGLSPDDLRLQHCRVVDFCSAAFLLMRRSTWEMLGGFDEEFAPAYYEETDLCLRMRRAGLVVVYNSRARIRHFEFASSGRSRAFELMKRNHDRFYQKHQDLLLLHARPGQWASFYRNGRGVEKRQRWLYLDDRIPHPFLGAGLPRTREILTCLAGLDCEVTFVPTICGPASVPLANDVEAHWVAYVPLPDRSAQRRFIQEEISWFDVVFVSRPHNKAFLDECLAELGLSLRDRPVVIYDAEAIFAERDILQYSVRHNREMPGNRARALLEAELNLIGDANVVTVVTARDRDTVARLTGRREIEVLGHATALRPSSPGFQDRHGTLFIGPVHDDDTPNADSIFWMIDYVLPVLWDRARIPLRVAGLARSRRIYEHLSQAFVHLGPVDDTQPVYDGARVFVCPTRFAAGMPLKMVEAMAAGIPVVCSSLVASQMDLHHEREVLVANTATAFAEEVIRLHGNEQLWNSLRTTALERVEREYSRSGMSAAVQRLKKLVAETGTEKQRLAAPQIQK